MIDKNLYSTFQPLLYQVATGGLNPGDVSYAVGGFTVRRHPLRPRRPGRRRHGGAQRIKLTDGRELGYDYLIIATGVAANYFGVKGAEENTFGALHPRRRDRAPRPPHERLRAAERGLGRPQRSSRSRWSAAAPPASSWPAPPASCAATCSSATFPDVDPSRVHVRLIEMAPALLMPFHPKLREYARQAARRSAVWTSAEHADPRGAAGPRDPRRRAGAASDLTVWAAGVAARAVTGWGLPQGKGGRILVGPDLRVEGSDRIFAVGDIALEPAGPVARSSRSPRSRTASTPPSRSRAW